MDFLQSVLFVECLCYNSDIIISPDNMEAGGMLYEAMALSDRGGGGRRQYGGGRRGDRYGGPGRAARNSGGKGATGNGKYGLIEIKLGGDKLIEEGANSLKTMESKIDTDKMNAPSFLMVLTGTGDYAYRRSDGVYVVPIGCLKN